MFDLKERLLVVSVCLTGGRNAFDFDGDDDDWSGRDVLFMNVSLASWLVGIHVLVVVKMCESWQKDVTFLISHTLYSFCCHVFDAIIIGLIHSLFSSSLLYMMYPLIREQICFAFNIERRITRAMSLALCWRSFSLLWLWIPRPSVTIMISMTTSRTVMFATDAVEEEMHQSSVKTHSRIRMDSGTTAEFIFLSNMLSWVWRWGSWQTRMSLERKEDG